MFLQKITTTLATEIKWGRIALLALGAAVVALLVSGGAYNMLSLTVFSIVGIFMDRVAPKHPYLNAFFYGVLGTLSYVILIVLQALGEGQAGLLVADVLWLVLSVALVVVFQSLIGAWIGTSIRKITRIAAESRQGQDTAPDKKAGNGDRQAAPPKKTTSTARRPKKKG